MRYTNSMVEELYHQVGKLFAKNGETFLLNNPELLDAYDAIMDYNKKSPRIERGSTPKRGLPPTFEGGGEAGRVIKPEPDIDFGL